MDLVKALIAFFLCACHVLSYSIFPVRQDIQLKLLKQEHMPSIEYKYVVKTILPVQDRWWRRGTHRFYADEKDPKIIEA